MIAQSAITRTGRCSCAARQKAAALCPRAALSESSSGREQLVSSLSVSAHNRGRVGVLAAGGRGDLIADLVRVVAQSVRRNRHD